MFSLVGVVCCVVVCWLVVIWLWIVFGLAGLLVTGGLSGLDLFCGFDFGFVWLVCLRC